MGRSRAVVLRGGLAAALLLVLSAAQVLAHDQPEGDGAEYIMFDWMMGAFAVFFTAALIFFFSARRRGLLTDLEAAKYYVLTVRDAEPDYYTPDWAREDDEEEDSRKAVGALAGSGGREGRPG